MPSSLEVRVSECIFCRIVAGTERSWKVYETPHIYAFLDTNPLSEYHTLVVPKRHYINVFDVAPDAWLELMAAVKAVVDRFRERLGVEHVQIVNNSGGAADQQVFHLHIHVIPRGTGGAQQVTWSPRPELRERFDAMLAELS